MVRGATVAAGQLRRPYPAPVGQRFRFPLGRAALHHAHPLGHVAPQQKARSYHGATQQNPLGTMGFGAAGAESMAPGDGAPAGCGGTHWVSELLTQRVLGNPLEGFQWAWEFECDNGLPRNLAFDGLLFEKH